MRRFRIAASIVLVTMSVVSCSSARVVQMDPGRGGVIALSSRNSQGARERANRLMAENCPGGNFEVAREFEAVVGETTRQPMAAASVSRNIGVGVGKSSSRHATEWRVQYQCSAVAE